MKAWQFTGTGQPLALNEVAEPKAAPGEVVIDIKAAGLCHSDIGTMEDPKWLALLAKTPITLGHEVAGVISQIGENTRGYAIGDRVAIHPLSKTRPGYNRDGGYATKTTSRAEDLVRIPDNVSFAQAAVATDAGMTSHHAIVGIGGVKAGTKVGIIGIGGLGQIGARVAVLLGAEVYAAEVNEAAWPLARALGVTAIANDISAFKDQDLDVIVDFAGFGTTTDSAIATVRHQGLVVLVGMGRLQANINTMPLIRKEVRLAGSVGGSADDIRAVLGYIANGSLTPVLAPITFDEIPDGLARLKAHTVKGRLVAEID